MAKSSSKNMGKAKALVAAHRPERRQRRSLRRLGRAARRVRVRRQRHGGARQAAGHQADRPADQEGDARGRARGDAQRRPDARQRRPVLPHLLRPRRPGARRQRRRGRQEGRDLVPLRRPADRRRALRRARPVRRRRAHPRPVRQLPQRHRDARGDLAADDDPEPAAEADARRGRDAHLPRAQGVLRQAAEGRRRAPPASRSSIPTPRWRRSPRAAGSRRSSPSSTRR